MSPRRVVVAGAMANKPGNGGEAWVRLSWARGLARLGCEVWFVEQIAGDRCVDAAGRAADFASSANRRWFVDVMRRFGMTSSAALLCDDGRYVGADRDAVRDVLAGADLLVDISGHLTDAGLRDACRQRVYVDIDPGFTQIWHATGDRRLGDHDRYVTIGERIGTPSCVIPTCGLTWHHVRQPVVLDDFPMTPPPAAVRDEQGRLRFTTVASWRGPYGPVELDRRRFGLKVHEFRKYLTMPWLVDASFEAALSIHPEEVDDLTRLHRAGWRLHEPQDVAGTPEQFRDFVVASAAEFSVAQGVYVDTGSGWFSDRTVRYLASGRPALVQDTGFTATLPHGCGLVAFRDLDGARVGAESIIDEYASHCEAARAIAVESFDSDVVLADFFVACLDEARR